MSVKVADVIFATERASRPWEAPPLMAGNRLSRAEFERRYRYQPEVKKAERIEGVVYVPSLVTDGRHANPHHLLVTWTGNYLAVERQKQSST